jgi:exopolysaccharide biosynthesis polyprenyl glycosylphosphotransferase
MLKKHEKKFYAIQRLTDIFAITAAWLISYYIRFYIIVGGQQGLALFYLKLTPIVILLNIFFFFKNRLYASNRFYSWHKEILSVFYSTLQGTFAIIILFFFVAPNKLSRITLLIYALISVISTITVRLVARNLFKTLRSKGKNLRHIILIGHSRLLRDYVETIFNIKGAGLYISGWIDSNGLSEEYNIPEIQLEEKFETTADAVVIGYPPEKHERQNNILKTAYKLTAQVFILPDIAYTFIGNRIEDFEGIPMIKVNAPRLGIISLFLKRVFDVAGSLFGLIVLSPLLLITALAVKLTSKGPIFYGQERMSLDGEKFKMWKFRSMRTDAEEKSGAVWTVENDDRRTPIGAFLRSTSLDELPQLWNVLIGDMSLIGPRPERPVFVEKFKDEIPAYMVRHKMKAGITGWAQANGWRGNTSLEKRIEFDIYYIKNWSLIFDFKILLLTIVRGFINKNAY